MKAVKKKGTHNKPASFAFEKPEKKIFYFLPLVTMHNFTPEDLLLYLYKETDATTTAAIETALEKDWTLREKLSVLKASMARLDAIKETPRTEVVLNILNYARQEEKTGHKKQV